MGVADKHPHGRFTADWTATPELRPEAALTQVTYCCLASALLPRVHRVISILKRWLLGTHQGAVSRAHLDYYLDEFTFGFNRRTGPPSREAVLPTGAADRHGRPRAVRSAGQACPVRETAAATLQDIAATLVKGIPPNAPIMTPAEGLSSTNVGTVGRT